MDNGGAEMDHGGEACVGFVAAQGDALELFQLAEEVLDQMAPFVDLLVDGERCLAPWHLRDDDLGAALIQLVDDPVRIEGLVADQAFELDVLDQRYDPDGVVAMSRKQDKADQVTERVRQRQDFRRQAPLGAAYGLALSPPFAP